MGLSVVSIVEPGRTGVNEAVRDAAALVCAASSGVHAGLAPAHLREGATTGSAFVLSALLLAMAALGLRATTDADRWCAAVLAGVAGCYLLSRTAGVPLLIPEPEPVDVVGTLTSLAEVAAAAAVLCLPRVRKEPR